MLDRVRKTIENHSLLNRGDHLLVAVSGGADSVALLRILVRLADEYRLRLTSAHLNHGLRGAESDRDEGFVRDLSAEMGIDSICKAVDIASLSRDKGRSVEDIGREERYRFFGEAAEKCGAGKIATGHHRDDQAETVLMHLLRGSGPEGLRGILPIRSGRLIRPLIDVGRDQILEFLRQDGCLYTTDSSNASPVFLRNRIRVGLIPELKAKYNPRLVEGLCHTAGIIRREDDYLQSVVHRIVGGWGIASNPAEAIVPIAAFRELHEALQGRIIKLLLEAYAPSGNGIAYRHIEAVLGLAGKPDGRLRSLNLPFGIRVEREGKCLRIQKENKRKPRGREDETFPPIFEYSVEIPATIRLEEIDRTIRLELTGAPTIREMKDEPRKAFMDYGLMSPPLILRNAEPGDRIDLFGTGGSKKLKKYFIDRKIPRTLRRQIPLLVDSSSVLWIAGERISERVRVTAGTKMVLKAEMV